MSHYENAALDTLEKVSKSVIKINTIKLVHNILYQAVSISEKVTICALHKGRKRYFKLKLTKVP